jgi:hypothetical protein
MKAYRGVDLKIHVFLTSALVVSGQLHTPAALPLEKSPTGTHWIGGCVDQRAGLDDAEERKFLTSTELGPLSRPTHSQSLYRLSCPDSLFIFRIKRNVFKKYKASIVHHIIKS